MSDYWNRKGLARLWVGLAAGPIAWAIDLEAGYAIVPWACGENRRAVFFLISLATFALATIGLVVAWRTLALLPAEATLDGGLSPDRSRFLAWCGVALSALTMLLILGNAVPRTLLGPCD